VSAAADAADRDGTAPEAATAELVMPITVNAEHQVSQSQQSAHQQRTALGFKTAQQQLQGCSTASIVTTPGSWCLTWCRCRGEGPVSDSSTGRVVRVMAGVVAVVVVSAVAGVLCDGR
jgi:hypothetical protein